MRQRGASTLGAVLLAAAAGVFAAAALADWVVVDVQTRGDDAMRLVIPFPLVIGDLAASFVPDRVLAEAAIPAEASAQREAVMAALSALVEAPDALLVKVQDGADHVEIHKLGDQLTIRVEADDATVRCQVPIAAVHAALERWDWQQPDPRLLLDILHGARSGELVHVEAEDARVTVRVW